MAEIITVLFFIGITVKALTQVRRDSRFTPRVIWLHILAILLFLTYSGFGVYALMKAPFWKTLNDLNPDAQFAILIILFLLWLTIGLIILTRYLNKLLKREGQKQSK